jgi:hypothetical protein
MKPRVACCYASVNLLSAYLSTNALNESMNVTHRLFVWVHAKVSPTPLFKKQTGPQFGERVGQNLSLLINYQATVGDVRTFAEGAPVFVSIERQGKSGDVAPIRVRWRQIAFGKLDVRYPSLHRPLFLSAGGP